MRRAYFESGTFAPGGVCGCGWQPENKGRARRAIEKAGISGGANQAYSWANRIEYRGYLAGRDGPGDYGRNRCDAAWERCGSGARLDEEVKNETSWALVRL